ncbi:MAG: glycosyltransferase family 4 protein [Hydrogenophaga sp.]|jgi:glycosyltransferase involved in cell wall biosynthesis|uniref:glycosyltransferase family 4 protein n=1 Tax=Hydrogenophaga sp. TaxID=1904254 RepID=UPI002630E9DF|nr:glycosyltransferase family 1 protein [Hydrogenophaga sp.]MCW5668568.1 glycosyltransferase family 4 protein [Hydrogenophaga sp.]
MTRIAFTLIGGKAWTGGYNYLLNLLRVITQRHPGVLQPVLFFGTDIDSDDARPFQSIAGVEIVTSPCMNADRRTASLLRSLVLGADPATRRLLHEHRIDVVFENAQFHGARLGIPAIAWIPDFQHRELPHLFSRAAWWKRELGFRAQIHGGRAIMLSSGDARDGCERYYPTTVGRTHLVRFAVPSAGRPDAATVQAAREAHGLPERFFYLPNQFWQHKNHLLVIEALALLKQEGHSVVVAASGKQLDPYRPDHFQRITERLTTTGVANEFRLLGLIPYEHVAPLMVGSVAVLNPSLFEGWSTTVEEARALRVPLVLSDLAVHQEQASGMARFFDRTSARSLADALLEVWRGQDTLKAGDAAAPTPAIDPVQRFADDFVDLVRQVTSQRHPTPKAST